MLVRLTRWTIFGVIIAFLPIAYSAVSLATHGVTGGIEKSIEHGELLILAAAICAAAVGELVPTGTDLPLLKLFSIGGALVIIIFATLCFADFSTAYLYGVKVDVTVISKTSIWVFVCGVVSSGSCVALAKG